MSSLLRRRACKSKRAEQASPRLFRTDPWHRPTIAGRSRRPLNPDEPNAASLGESQISGETMVLSGNGKRSGGAANIPGKFGLVVVAVGSEQIGRLSRDWLAGRQEEKGHSRTVE
ncbi:hypothetical protein DTO164E3_8209 [Paecilomyces variotii]|nr:hypothetical protein DTO164E3_8209 [Paecilomyces variotii]KAJ9195859.1 hypothetical protein DTO032I3_6694 [Paecilomyces variotii]KAJ9276189.1 hypothetical protein DTO021D3_6957 [Paecilomyces variotii]KAJ9340827.1 hypothetical protein DTO027B6_6634 [Paecilomyces variotii]KAJ9392187.1 hypothetical protein DTO032I4_601 [Paecilomyces variotii]